MEKVGQTAEERNPPGAVAPPRSRRGLWQASRAPSPPRSTQPHHPRVASMPPAQNKADKAKQAAAAKKIEDKTFGMKNKNK